MKRIELQRAYVLHRRPYRETSFIVELFTPEYGRLAGVAKGVRKARSSTQGLWQPFSPLLVTLAGKGELMTITHVEAQSSAAQLKGQCLFAGFYLNELLMNLLQKWDPHPRLFSHYEKALTALQAETLEQETLRSFEKGLLEEIGYGLLPSSETALLKTFSADKFYRFTTDQGFVQSEMDAASSLVFSGKNLIAIAKENWQEDVLQDAKRLIRLVLASLLGTKEIHSRKLFI